MNARIKSGHDDRERQVPGVDHSAQAIAWRIEDE
jgi:hypothetical protein